LWLRRSQSGAMRAGQHPDAGDKIYAAFAAKPIVARLLVLLRTHRPPIETTAPVRRTTSAPTFVSLYLHQRTSGPVLFVVMIAVALLTTTGTIAIPTFWIYVAIDAFAFVLPLAIVDPSLLQERVRPGGKRVPIAQHVFIQVLYAHWVVIGLDRGRFHWSDTVPVWRQAVTFAVLAAALRSCFGQRRSIASFLRWRSGPTAVYT
jgi:hypothetical protein